MEFREPSNRKASKGRRSLVDLLKWRPHITGFDHVALNVNKPDEAREFLKALGFNPPSEINEKYKDFDGYTIGEDAGTLRVEPYMDPSGNIINLVFDTGGASVVKRHLDYEGKNAAIHHLGLLVNGPLNLLEKGAGILEKFVKRPSLKTLLLHHLSVNTTQDSETKGFLSQTFLAPLSIQGDAVRLELISRFKWPWFVEQNSRGLEKSIRENI